MGSSFAKENPHPNPTNQLFPKPKPFKARPLAPQTSFAKENLMRRKIQLKKKKKSSQKLSVQLRSQLTHPALKCKNMGVWRL